VIRDATELAEVQANWAGLEALRSKLQRSAFAPVAGAIGGTYPFALANAAHNLPFIHAFAVLNDVLEQLAKEQQWPYQGRVLGRLLEDSEQALPWRGFGLIEAGAERRNDVAHRG
jgi:hypothetical protein